MKGFWYNKKNKRRYLVIDVATNATNLSCGEKMVIYRDMKGKLYVRELEEFKDKFKQ